MEDKAEYKVNRAIWDKCSKPPKKVLKTIQAGRLKGMSDIKPQWRYEIMTEMFGPCGVGWKYTINELRTFEGSEGQIIASACVDLYYNHEGEWSEPVPGVGGSMLVANEKNGPHTSDEAFKMAVTDALSVAMSRIGVAAEVYMGNWDGSKYRDSETTKEVTNATNKSAESGNESLLDQIDLYGNADDLKAWKSENEKLINVSSNKGEIMTKYFQKIKELK